MKRLHLDRFELAERDTTWDAEDGGEVDATEVAAELRSLRAAVAESPVVRRNAVRAAVDAERARIVARMRSAAGTSGATGFRAGLFGIRVSIAASPDTDSRWTTSNRSAATWSPPATS